ncbi:MAG: hypothetical protein ABIP03_11875 [Aquihabitans sp.]
MITAIGLIGRTWVPVGDEAVIVLRTSQIGSTDTPLVGVYSTHGWSHPGPILYWLLAPAYFVSNGNPSALLFTSLLLNTAGVAALAVAAWRLGGRRLLTITGFFLLLLIHGLRPELLLQIWNPYVPLIAFGLFLFTTWGIAAGSNRWLWAGIALGSALVQLHVAYLPLVGSAGVTVVGLRWALRRTVTTRPNRRQLLTAAAVFLILWVAPALDLVFGDRQTWKLVRYFAAGSSGSIGYARGAGILSNHLSPFGPWSVGTEVSVFGNVVGGSLFWLALVLVALTISASWAFVTKRPQVAIPAILCVIQVTVGVAAASRLEEPVLSYLVVWMLPLAMFVWLVLLWSLVHLIDALVGTRATQHASAFRLGSIGAQVAAVALIAGPLSATLRAAPKAPLPRAEFRGVVEHIAPKVATSVGTGPVRIEGIGDDFQEGWVGVLFALDRDGVPFFTSDGYTGQKWGRSHRWRGQQVNTSLSVVVSLPTRYSDPVAICDLDVGLTKIAEYDRLSAASRAELKALQVDNYTTRGELSFTQRQRLSRLTRSGYRMAVYSGDHICAVTPGR